MYAGQNSSKQKEPNYTVKILVPDSGTKIYQGTLNSIFATKYQTIFYKSDCHCAHFGNTVLPTTCKINFGKYIC